MKIFKLIPFLLFLVLIFCQKTTTEKTAIDHLRGLADTVGFAHTAQQMDSVMSRINRIDGQERRNIFQIQDVNQNTAWQMVICPHDDYSYAGVLYPYVLKNLTAPTVIIIGVAHRAKDFNIADKIVFDRFSQWRGPYGNISVSPLREEIISQLPEATYIISDSLQEAEHSVEALLPFIQSYNHSVNIISILVPYMNFETMDEISVTLANAIESTMESHQMKWGRDLAIAISNDCVHYGDQDWGGKNYAPLGADTAGYRAATNFDMNIITECLIEQLDPQRIRRFSEYTVDSQDYTKYAWTWCGRYSIPFGLLTGYYLSKDISRKPLYGTMLRYRTSISQEPIPVQDLGMGITAPANIHHWVGYVAIGYRF
jgi:MEMO1 family protein